MTAVVARGTGGAAAVSGVAVAGKTGTAENPHGAPHAWFVGYAPAGKPKVAVAILLENAGGGGAYAAPLASRLLQEALSP
jgi:peptidoglycan glycosyltransferase